MPYNRKYVIVERRKRIAELYLKGHYQQQIADTVGVSRRQVGKDLEKINEMWQKECVTSIEKAKTRELMKIDKLEQTYWEAWEKSIKDYNQKIEKQKGKPINLDPESPPTIKTDSLERTKKEVLNFGNPAYLAGIERCIDLRCKILGIHAPTEVKHSGNLFLELMKKSTQQGNGNQ